MANSKLIGKRRMQQLSKKFDYIIFFPSNGPGNNSWILGQKGFSIRDVQITFGRTKIVVIRIFWTIEDSYNITEVPINSFYKVFQLIDEWLHYKNAKSKQYRNKKSC